MGLILARLAAVMAWGEPAEGEAPRAGCEGRGSYGALVSIARQVARDGLGRRLLSLR